MNKRGMQLAVNTLVVLILGVIIVGGGITLVSSIYDKASELPTEVSRNTEQQLFNMIINSKQRIAVLNNVQTIERKETATFPVAFQNQLPEEDATFTLLEPELVTQPDDVTCESALADSESCPHAALLPGDFTLKRFDNQAFYVNVYAPKKTIPGEYAYNILVNDNTGNLYARAKVMVVVK